MRRRAEWALWLLGLSLAGCSPRLIRWVPTPSASSLILLVYSGPELTSATAYEIDSGVALELSVPESTTKVFGVAYPEPLSGLGLAPGVLSLSPVGGTLPSTPTAVALEVKDGIPGEWVPLSTSPPEITSLRFGQLTPCADFSATYIHLPGTVGASPSVMVPLGTNRALVGTNKGQFFTVADAEATPRTNLSTSTPFLGGWETEQGEIWLAGPAGRVMHGDPDRGFYAAPSMNNRELNGLAITGAPPGHPFELFVVTSSVGVEHFDGTSWRILVPPSAIPVDSTRIQVVWIGPGKAAVLGLAIPRVLEVDTAGNRQTFDVSLNGPDSLFALSYVPGIGPMMGTRYGILFVRNAQGWTPLEMPPSTARDDFILPYGMPGGYLVGGEGGSFLQFIAGFGYCDQKRAMVGRSVDGALVVGQDLIFGVASPDAEVLLSYVRRL
ncbi:MAG: hypothetical protein U1E65_16665 [Myxococcota bacterium]